MNWGKVQLKTKLKNEEKNSFGRTPTPLNPSWLRSSVQSPLLDLQCIAMQVPHFTRDECYFCFQAGGFSSGLSSRSTLSDMERDMARHVSSSLSTTRSPLNTTGSSASSSTYKTEKYSSSVSSTNAGLPHRYQSASKPYLSVFVV